MTGFEPAIPRSTICGSEDVKEKSRKGLRVSGSEFAHSVPTDTCQTSPDLDEIMHAWESLDEAVRSTILMLVRSASKGAKK